MKRTFLFLFVFILGKSLFLSAQTAIVSAGGDASSSSGSVSYSVGQIAVTHSGNNLNTVSEGVQQTYQIATLIENCLGIELNAVAYPNPTIGIIQLSLTNFDLSHRKLEAKIYNENGKFLSKVNVWELQTLIDLSNYATGTYLLTLSEGTHLLKSFKIVKVQQ